MEDSARFYCPATKRSCIDNCVGSQCLLYPGSQQARIDSIAYSLSVATSYAPEEAVAIIEALVRCSLPSKEVVARLQRELEKR